MSYRTKRLFYSAVFCGLSVFSLSFSAHADLHDISRIFKQTPMLDAFEVCHGGGCSEFNQLSISQAEWASVAQIFAEPVSNAAEERERIAKALGEFERIIGAKNGTMTDLAGTFYDDNITGQLDCNDEAMNTTTYLRLLKVNGLMRFHEIDDIRTRNFFFTGWPHSTASMHETETGKRFAVDSWFYNNGHAAVVVPFSDWKAGYRPADTPIDMQKRSSRTVR